MSIPGSASPLLLASTAAAAGGYQISRSLRFNSADSAYLSRTPAVAGNQQTFSISFWTKLASVGPFTFISSGSGNVRIGTTTNNVLAYDITPVSGSRLIRTTTAVLRDPSAWYHVLFSVNTTSATQEYRFRVYVNGVEILFDVLSLGSGYLPQNSTIPLNNTSLHEIGRRVIDNDTYWNGYLADIHFIDGQALTPSSFTEVSATTGQLIPKAYTGTYGTNGFQLKFADNSSNTAATLGKDTSGNGNNWTPNNLSITAGAGNDSLVDSPTSYGTDTGVGGEVRGNYCTLNPLKTTFSGDGSLPSQSNGNLDVTGGGGTSNTVGTIGVSSGKFYYETTLTATHDLNACIFGLGQSATAYSNNFGLRPSGSFGGTITSGSAFAFAIGDTVGIAYEPGVSATFYKNNNASSFVASLSSGIWFPWAQLGGTTVSAVYNFGQRPFVNQSVPSGFKALCDTNLGAPLTAKPNTLMDVALYTGNGSTQTISGLAFSPDLVWIKSRSGADNHAIQDAVRGATLVMQSNTTNAEVNASNTVGSFTSDGFSLAGAAGSTNGSSVTYVAWTWDAGTSTVSNTAGSITSQVRANVSAGFSVATLTTPGSGTFTVGHGLNVAPSLVICKARNAAFSWIVYHRSAGAGNYLVLNSTAASAASATVWQNTNPSSTIVYGDASNWGTADYVMYSFAPVVGYGNGLSYVGNGSADGPFVYLGFRPKLILIKCSSTTGNWVLLDAEREGYNVDNDPLFPNLSDAEGTTDLLDITSNGFKIRSTNADVNASAATYIVYAWASNPFQYSRAR